MRAVYLNVKLVVTIQVVILVLMLLEKMHQLVHVKMDIMKIMLDLVYNVMLSAQLVLLLDHV